MLETFKFGRLDSTTRLTNFIYKVTNGKDAEWSPRSVAMEDAGTHWSVTVKNHLREDVILVSSLRSEPIRIGSIYSHDNYALDNINTYVTIELRQRSVERHQNGAFKISSQKKVEIRCPSHYLQTQSLFIEELGCYLTIESRLQATKECIAQDVRSPQAREINVPASMVAPDPASTFSDYEMLVKNSIERADRIQVRVGVRVDLSPNSVPQHVKNMRIAVLDRDFSPYYNNKMVYDPTLSPEEFVVENLHFVVSAPFVCTWEKLHKAASRSIFIDTEEHRTLGGVLCGLVIFADENALHDYLFRHRAEDVYAELINRVEHRNGDHSLLKSIEELKNNISVHEDNIAELEKLLKFEREQNKQYKRIVSVHEDTIKRFQNDTETQLSYNATMEELENEKRRLEVDRAKLEHEKDELEHKKAIAESTHKASMLKSVADIIKSGWGIATLIVTACLTLYKGYEKLKSLQK